MADPKPAIPKFASFRSKPTKDDALNHDPDKKIEKKNDDRNRKDREDRGRYSRRHDERDDHDNRPRGRRDDGERKRKRSRSRERKSKSQRTSVEPEGLIEDATLLRKEIFENESNAYRIDKKGDLDNVRFRRLHAYSVPAYRRSGHGSVLGSSPEEKIDRSRSDEKSIVLTTPERRAKAARELLHKAWLKKSQKLRLIKFDEVQSENDHTTEDHASNFISLTSKKNPKVNKNSRDDPTEPDYRSIERPLGVLRGGDDSDVMYESATDESAADFIVEDSSARRAGLRNTELTRRTHDRPQDLVAWLELIDHQHSFHGGFTSRSLGSVDESKAEAIAKARVPIYKEAIQTVTDVEAKVTLALGMLVEETILKKRDPQGLASTWQAILRTFKDPRIWIGHIDFQQLLHPPFKYYEDCSREFIRCFKVLGDSVTATSDASERAEASRHLDYAFFRFTVLARESGRHELAEALWQAALELCLFRSAETPTDPDALAEAFEEFWESEVPRIGDADAKGWLNFDPDATVAPDPITIEVGQVKPSTAMFRDFAILEQETSSRLMHPGRTQDDAGENDPYHIVMFADDLKDLLFPHLLNVEGKSDLIAAFLQFLGLPPLPCASGWHFAQWRLDPLLPSSSTEPLITHEQTTTETLFTTAFAKINVQDMNWTRRALRALVDACPSDDILAEYLIAFEFHFFPAQVTKTAKGLLKKRSSSLRLYNCYTILECRKKDFEAGSKIFGTAINMSSSFREDQRRHLPLLHRTWAWESLRVGSTDTAIGILRCLGDQNASYANLEDIGKVSNPAADLREMTYLKQQRDAMLSAREPYVAVLYIELLALAIYLRHDRDLGAALDAFTESETILTSWPNLNLSSAHETLHQSRCQLIQYHKDTVKAYKPKFLRAELEASIRLFPNNTMFLIAHDSISRDLDVASITTKSLLDDVVLAEGKDTVVGWSFAIDRAMQRSLESGNTNHNVRAIFERAVARAGKHSIYIWTQFLQFEIAVEQAEAKLFGTRGHASKRKGGKNKATPELEGWRAYEIFLRGLQVLPWSKEWILLGLSSLDPEGLGFEESRRVWNVLQERDLRVVVDIEGIVDDEVERRGELSVR